MKRDFQFPGRSPVLACQAMAATSHPLATLAAIDTLREGGTAADAAVAAAAVLCVVEPHMTGIGGDCFALVSRPGRPVWGYNGCGRAAAAGSAEALRARGLTEIGSSIHAVTVPGAVEAWQRILEAHGRFGLDRVLAPAIRHAEDGFPVAARVAWDWSRYLGKLKADPGTARHYLFGGTSPREGDVIRFPQLAQVLRAIARRGSRAFYEGEIAEDMVTTLAARGSFLTAEDFAAHRGEVVEPISTNYRGIDFLEIPPNAQGLTALAMLNVLEHFNLSALDPVGPERLHLVLEVARLGYAIRDTHIGDPAFMRVAPRDLLDKGFATKLALLIDPNKRAKLPTRPTPGGDTVYLTVVDRDRMAVSFINSLYSNFGLGLCTEKTGILFNNRGACFTLEPDHVNEYGPGKRPMHTIIPALAMRGDRCHLSFGVMGAHYQPMGHVHFATNMIDYRMDVQQAIDSPRFFFEGDKTVVERGIPPKTIEGLAARGHDVAVAPTPWGGAQAVELDWERGVLIGGSDARKDGCALGY